MEDTYLDDQAEDALLAGGDDDHDTSTELGLQSSTADDTGVEDAVSIVFLIISVVLLTLCLLGQAYRNFSTQIKTPDEKIAPFCKCGGARAKDTEGVHVYWPKNGAITRVHTLFNNTQFYTALYLRTSQSAHYFSKDMFEL